MPDSASVQTRLLQSASGKLFVLSSLYCILYSPILAATNTGVLRPLVLIGLMGALLGAAQAGALDIRMPVSVFGAGAGLFVTLALAQSLALFRGGDTYLVGLLIAVFTGILPLAYLIVWASPKNRPVLSSLARATAGLGALQSVLIVADWGFPGIRAAFSSVVVQPESLDSGFRAAGLTSMTGDGLSVSQAVCVVCAMYLAVIAEQNRVALAWGAIVALILATMVFVGRTGFVLIAVFTMILLLFGHQRRRVVVGLMGVVLLFLVGVWLMSVSIKDDRLVGLFVAAASSAFEAFIGLGQGDGFRTASTDDLWSMFVVPDSLRGWLIGDGFYSNPAYLDGNYMGTDIGYLRVLLYVGVIGSLAIYTWYLSVAVWSFRAFRRHHDRVFSVGLMCCFLVSQVKFSFMLLLAPLGFTLLVFFAAAREQSRCV